MSFDLEDRLHRQSGIQASVDLRGRVMQAMADELASPASAVSGDGWYWAKIAAAAIVALNLSLIDASVAKFTSPLKPSAAQIIADIQARQQLAAAQEGSFK